MSILTLEGQICKMCVTKLTLFRRTTMSLSMMRKWLDIFLNGLRAKDQRSFSSAKPHTMSQENHYWANKPFLKKYINEIKKLEIKEYKDYKRRIHQDSLLRLHKTVHNTEKKQVLNIKGHYMSLVLWYMLI